MLRHLYDAGLSIARLNGSHSDLNWHRDAIRLIRSELPEVPILLDIPGRKIRTGNLVVEPTFNAGDIVTLTTDSDNRVPDKILVNYLELHNCLNPGDIVFADDGTIRFTVQSLSGKDILCRAEVSGQLKSKKGINVPFVSLSTPLVTDRDREMISFAKSNGVDYVGISFVESAMHVEAIRALAGSSIPKIVAKVENMNGFNAVNEIVAAADAIMIDRGDLSVETSLEDVAVKQKLIINSAKKSATPVIVATEMLHSMISNPFPTKAEISDITNAVFDGCSATMLSGETAVGEHAIESVRVMASVIDAAESYLINATKVRHAERGFDAPRVMGSVIPEICQSLPITKIVAITRSGYAAKEISSYGLAQPIIAVSDDSDNVRSFNLYPGVTGVYSRDPFLKSTNNHILSILKMLVNNEYLLLDDYVLVSGVSYPKSGNRMNTIQIHFVRDLVALFDSLK